MDVCVTSERISLASFPNALRQVGGCAGKSCKTTTPLTKASSAARALGYSSRTWSLLALSLALCGSCYRATPSTRPPRRHGQASPGYSRWVQGSQAGVNSYRSWWAEEKSRQCPRLEMHWADGKASIYPHSTLMTLHEYISPFSYREQCGQSRVIGIMAAMAVQGVYNALTGSSACASVRSMHVRTLQALQ